MAIPAGRIDDKIHAARFRAKAGLVIGFEPNYCEIGVDYLDVDFSPVPIFDLSNLRVCEDVDVTWDATTSYSPFDTLVGPPPAGTTWVVDWGDGNTSSGNNIATASGSYGAAANEWDLDAADAPADGVYTIIFTLTDDSGLQTIIEQQIQVIECAGLFAGLAGLYGDGPYAAPGAGADDWIAAPGDLDGDLLNVNAAIIDDSNSGFWIATDGGIAYSGDNGQHWKRIENSAPQNSWNDGIAPAGDDVRYVGIVQSKGNANQLFALARWQEAGGNWRSAIRYSYDRGKTWAFHNLGGNNGLAAANWGYPYSFVQDVWCWTDNPGVGFEHQAPSSHIHIDTANVTQAAGEGGARITWNYNKVNTDSILQTFVIDLGVYITLSNATQIGGINCRGRTGDCTDTMTWLVNIPLIDLSTATLDPQPGHGPGTSCPINGISQLLLWDSAVVGYPPDNVTRTALAHLPLEIFRYAVVTFSHTPQFYTGQGYNELIFQWFQFYPHVIYDEIYVIGADTSQDGQYLHVTAWEGEALRHCIYDLSDDSLRLIGVVNLGGATLAQVQARMYWARPFCPDGYTGSVVDKVYIYGRMNHPTLGIVQLIESDNRGETTADLSDATWTTEWIGAMEIDPLYPDTIYVCLNSGASRMWISDNGGTTWFNVSALGFQVEAMDLNPDYEFEIIIGNRTAAANPIKYSMDDGLSWFTVSVGLPAMPTGGVGGIYLTSERL